MLTREDGRGDAFGERVARARARVLDARFEDVDGTRVRMLTVEVEQ